MKKILLLVMASILFACSSPEKRKNVVEQTGFEIVFREKIQGLNAQESFICVKDSTLYFVSVSAGGNLYALIPVENIKVCK